MARSVRRLVSLALCAGLFLVFFAGSWTDIFRSVPEQAERAYTAEQYEKALELYQEAQTGNPESDTLAYNLGNTLYKLGRFEETAGQYGKILDKESPALTPRALYNMGNTLFQMGSQAQNQEYLKQALEAYKQSIVHAPEDEDSKYNYELTRRLLKEQQQQKQQQQQQQDGEDQKKDDKQQQDKQQQAQQDQEKKKENQQQQQQQEKEQQQQVQQQPAKMSKEEAERILNALMQMEKEMQQKEKDKKKAVARSRGPDW